MKANARRAITENADMNIGTLSEYIGVSRRVARDDVKDLLAKRQEEQKYTAYTLYLLGYTQVEIGQAVGIAEPSLRRQYFSAKSVDFEKTTDLAEKYPSGISANSEFGIIIALVPIAGAVLSCNR